MAWPGHPEFAACCGLKQTQNKKAIAEAHIGSLSLEGLAASCFGAEEPWRLGPSCG